MAVAFVVVFSTFVGIQSFATVGASNEVNDEEAPIAETTIAVEETQPETAAYHNPVILCHGFIGGYGLTPWGIMKDRLVRDGWKREWIFEIYYKDPVFASNVQNAQELAAYVQ
jgi:hypothetical protein